MKEAVFIARKAVARDITLDCSQNPSQSFKTIQDEFYHPIYFSYNQYGFWFVTVEGKKVGVDENDGIIRRCTYGPFPGGYKRLISVQQNDRELVEIEFYVDEKTGDLNVHRYRNKRRVSNENHKLTGISK